MCECLLSSVWNNVWCVQVSCCSGWNEQHSSAESLPHVLYKVYYNIIHNITINGNNAQFTYTQLKYFIENMLNSVLLHVHAIYTIILHIYCTN